MGKAYFSVPFVERELLTFWYQYWFEHTPSAKALNAHKNGALRQVEVVLAQNKREAARIVADRNPRCIVIEDAIKREQTTASSRKKKIR